MERDYQVKVPDPLGEPNSMSNSPLLESNSLAVHLFRQIVETTQEGVWMVDAGWRSVYINPRMAAMLGYTVDQMLQRPWMDFMFPEDRPAYETQILLRRSGASSSYEHRFRHAGGQEIWCAVSATPVLDDQGQLLAAFALIRDITERKKYEQALLESENRYKSLYSLMRRLCDNVPDLIWVKDLEHRFLFTNQATCDKLLKAASTDEPLGKTDLYFSERQRQAHPDRPDWHSFGEICIDSDAVVIATQQPGHFAESGNVSGEFLNLDVYKTPLYDETGTMVGTVGCGRIVTYEKQIEAEQQQIAQKLRLSLDEKDVLLKEIHHRVKNNLQVIISLLSLQSEYVRDPVVRGMFAETQNRVRSMAFIHELLYRSDDLSMVNFRDYVEKLSEYLNRTYLINPDLIEIEIDVQDIVLSIERAIPCGLVINELISNSLKHAFPDNRSGKIRVSMKKQAGQIDLTVQDDGVGMPAGLDLNTTESLGFQLVLALAAQLNGTFSIISPPGAQCKLAFSEPNE
jgi:PAS domain S-box-containing protein